MAHTINKFIYTGQTDFDLSFSGGFRVGSDVTCYRSGTVQDTVQFDWLTESRVRIIPTGLTVGDEIHFVRTVSKITLPVDMLQPNNFTREAVVAACTHTLYALQEILDGRIDDFDGEIADFINSARDSVSNMLDQTAALTIRAETAAVDAEEVVVNTTSAVNQAVSDAANAVAAAGEAEVNTANSLAAANAAQLSAENAEHSAEAAASSVEFIAQDRAELIAETAVFPVGSVFFTKLEGARYEVVTSGGDLVTAAGQNLAALPGDEGVTPKMRGATGDGTTNDLYAFSGSGGYTLLPPGIYNVGSTKYTGLVYGPGSVRMAGSSATADAEGNYVGFDPAGSNVYATPNIWAESANAETSAPGGVPKYFNVAVAPGSNIRTTLGAAWRSTLLGSAVGQRIVDWERVEAIGNGAMRFARLANRVTAIGTIALQWLGANSQQFLRDTYHDFWNGTAKPGDADWDFMGLETRNPGIGAWLNNYSAYPTGREECSSLVAIGRDAGLHTIKDRDSVYVGYQCGTNTFDALQNTAVGSRALRDGVRAQRNTAVGRSAGFVMQQGIGNVYLGNVAGINHVLGDNSIFIGNSAGSSLGATISNAFVVQTGPSAVPLLLGDGGEGRLGLGVSDMAVLAALPGRGLVLNAPVGEAAATLRFGLATNVVEGAQSYGQIEWFGNDNQGAGVRARIRAVAVGTLGAADIDFATQPVSTQGDNPVSAFRVRQNGAVRCIPRATAPDLPAAGDMYYDSVTNKHRGYNGTAWFDFY